MAFVFVRIFGIETRLGVCEISKILTSAKLHTPEQIEQTQCTNYTLMCSINSALLRASFLNVPRTELVMIRAFFLPCIAIQR